jgi:hypothetical protein
VSGGKQGSFQVRVARMFMFVAMMAMLITSPGFAREASPEAPDRSADETANFHTRFMSLAESIPDWLERDDTTVLYADLEWRAEFVGFDPAESEDGLIDIRTGLGMAIPPAFMFASFFPHLGFTSTQVARTLTLDAISDKITLMQGDFDVNAVNDALIASGYVAEQVDGFPVFVFGGDDHIDPTTEVGGLALAGKTQYVIVLEDGLLGFTNKRAFAEQVIATQLGEASSLAANAEIEALVVSARSDLVSAQIWSSRVLGPSAQDPESDAGSVPLYGWALLGDSVGTGWSTGQEVIVGEPDAAGVIVLLLEDADQVETALAVVPERFATMTSAVTGTPYTDLLTLKSAEPGGSAGTAVFAFDIPIIGRLWQMFVARDLQFIYLD